MRVTNGEIFNAKEPLEKLVQVSLPVKVSLQVARLANKINVELRAIEDVRMGLIRKYGKVSEDGRQMTVDPFDGNYPKFLEEINELMSQGTEIVAENVVLPTTVDGKPLELEPSILMALEKFVSCE
jgi:hypothetical protein